MHYTVGMSDDAATTTADYDSPWKEAFTEYLEHAVALFLPAVHPQIDWSRGHDVLDKELQQATHDAALGRRLADLLVRVWRRDSGPRSD